MQDENPPVTPVGQSVGERFRFIFLTPWWRLAWFVGGVVWCGVLNIAFASTVGSDSWLGTLSVLPLYFFAGITLLRLYRRSRAAVATSEELVAIQGGRTDQSDPGNPGDSADPVDSAPTDVPPTER